jgi:tetratricopeptide (TPR) repeat protein
MEGAMRSIRKLLQAACAQAELLLVMDNFQWADNFTQELVVYLARNMSEEKFKLVLVGRDLEGLGSIIELSDMPQHLLDGIFLEGLQRGEQKAFFEENAPDIVPSEEDLEFLDSQYSGNPFHLMEAISFARDITGALGEDAGSKKWPSRSVLLKSKFRGLSPELKECLDIAAVQGEIFSAEEICSLTGRDRVEVLKFLSQLEEQKRLIARLKGMDFIFISPLVHQIAYDETPVQTRIEYHRTLAEIHERRVMLDASADDAFKEEDVAGSSHFESMVHHLLRSGEVDKLFRHLFRYLNLLTTTFRNEDARKAAELAREMLQHLPGSDSRWEKEYDLNRFLIQRGRYLGLMEELGSLVELNDRLARLMKSPERECEVCLQEAWIRRQEGDLQASYQCATRAVQIAQESGLDAMLPKAHLALGNFFWTNRDIPSALDAWTRARLLAGTGEESDTLAEIQNNLGNAHLALGDSAQARAAYEQALSEGNGSGPATRVRALGNLAHLDGLEGRINLAFERFRDAFQTAMTQGDLLTTARLQLNMASLAHRHGMFDLANSILPDAEDTAREFYEPSLLCDILAKKIELDLDLDRIVDVEEEWKELSSLERREDKRRRLQMLGLKLRIALKKGEHSKEKTKVPEKTLRDFHFLGTQLGIGWIPSASQYFTAHFALLNGHLKTAAEAVNAAMQSLPPHESLPHPLLPSLYWVGYRVHSELGNKEQAEELINKGLDSINRETDRLEDEDVRQSSRTNTPIHRMILDAAKTGGK